MIKFVFDYDKSRKMGIVQSEYLDNLREHFSVEDPIASLKKLRYGNFVPSRHYCITQAGRFKLGMFAEIANHIRTLGIPYKMVVTEPLKEAFFVDYGITDLAELSLPLRDYQSEVIVKALKQGNGVIEIGTGGGKTLIMATLVNTIREHLKEGHTTLVVVPGIQLVEQTYTDFLSYGIDKEIISKWSGNNKYKNTPIIIASSSILQSKKTDKTTYENTDLLLFDECLKKGQKLRTVNGLRNIEDIQIGDLVLSYNDKTNVNEYKKVNKTYKNMIKSKSYKHFLKITLESGDKIEVTPNHKVFTRNRGYVRADELKEDDDIKIL